MGKKIISEIHWNSTHDEIPKTSKNYLVLIGEKVKVMFLWGDQGSDDDDYIPMKNFNELTTDELQWSEEVLGSENHYICDYDYFDIDYWAEIEAVKVTITEDA